MERLQPSGSDRQFGLFMGTAAAIFAWVANPSMARPSFWSLALLVLAGVLISAAVLAPHLLRRSHAAWMQIGELLGRIVNPVVLSLLFLVVFVPVGLLMRLVGHDALALRRDSRRRSYWIDRPGGGPEPATIIRQF
jgi:hypothetical protein